MKLIPQVFLAAILTVNLAGTAWAQNATKSPDSLRSALLLHASFDRGHDADFAVGDATLYTAPTGNRKEAKPGLPADDLVIRVPGNDSHQGGLRFTKKMKPVVFFRGEKNLGYRAEDWSGSLSVWLRLDPDQELEPGYCDPLQFVAQDWNQGNMFIEFSKDHTPRHFRYAMLPVTKFWNPAGTPWEEIPENKRPMVASHRPPFARDRWTHVVFSFGKVNSGNKDAWGKLYLDGQSAGEFQGVEGVFNWEVSQSALTLGVSYVGLLDDLAVFNRPLTESEIKALFAAEGRTADLLK